MANISTKHARLLADFDKLIQRIKRAAKVDINETAAERRLRLDDIERDYVRWFEYEFPNYAKVKCAWFHRRLANAIIKNRRIRALAAIYRSGGKSVHIDLGIPLYLYLVKHDMRFMLLIGETDPKACKLLASIQAQLQYNERVKNDYGAKFQSGDWADGNFATVDGVRFQAIGYGASPRGAREDDARPDYIVVDDVDSRKHVNNDRLMEEGVNYITEDVWGSFDAADNATERFVYANNNFHKNSITNRLKRYFETQIKRAKLEKERSNFLVLEVNAVKDLSGFEPNWPEKTSVEYWRSKYNSTPYRSFMREYMNTHIADGSIFKAQDIVHGKMLSLDKYDALTFYGDLSYKDAGDYKAMILVGKTGREFHIINTYLAQGSRARCATWLYDTYEKYHLERYNIRYLIEGLFAMDQFVTDFDIEGDRRGYYVPVVADKGAKGNKYDRIESISGHFERHNVIFNDKEKDNPYQVTLIDQVLAFSKGSRANDDGPDALHGAFADLNKASFVGKFNPQIVSRLETQRTSKNRY